jgi:exopolyphosphatase/guanosine-5'-triphosphate,3'-diphosphate pyrophosphatase
MLQAPLAAIDVGSNTVHLVVARATADGRDLEYLADTLELVRLGADVSQSGAIGPQRLARAVAVVKIQAALAHDHAVARILGLATEGVRAAANGAELIERVRAETGVTLELVTGDQEATLTYWGATSGLEGDGVRRAALDLGGGSFEIVVGEGTMVRWRVSLPLGSGTMHDRFAPADPAQPGELAAVRRVVQETLGPLAPPLPVAEALVAGGTATALVQLAARALPAPGAATSVPGVLTAELLDALIALLSGLPAVEVTRRYGVDEARARLLPAGATVLLEALEWLGVRTLHVRGRGIREGALLAYLHHSESWLTAAAQGAGW